MGSVAKVSAVMEGERFGSKALKSLLEFIDQRRRSGYEDDGGFEDFEREVRTRFSEAERSGNLSARSWRGWM